MSENSSDQISGERRGFPIYKTNPSLGKVSPVARYKGAKVIEGNRAMLVDNATGEITGEGSVAFLERQEVDAEKFVKLYLAGLDGMFKLTKSGQRLFKILWQQVQEKPNSDRVELSRYIAEEFGDKMNERTFNRALRELLEKKFIYCSTAPGMFFFNVEFMFNGNRIITAREYVLKGRGRQGNLFESLPDDEHPPALTAE